MRNPLKSLYDWVLHWADTKYGTLALVLVAFSESSFFPIPPDVLLIPLSLSKPKKAFYYAGLTTLFSVLGAIGGYLIGLWLMDTVGYPILQFYSATDKFGMVALYYNKYNALAVGIAGFTPIPYKVFTIAAGACRINFPIFLIASIVSRGARFFIVATLLHFFGAKAKIFIDKHFNLLSLIFAILLIAGFVVIRYIF